MNKIFIEETLPLCLKIFNNTTPLIYGLKVNPSLNYIPKCLDCFTKIKNGFPNILLYIAIKYEKNELSDSVCWEEAAHSNNLSKKYKIFYFLNYICAVEIPLHVLIEIKLF